MKFDEFNFDDKILKATKEAGFIECSEVQEKSYPITLQGIDVLVQSKTGSGKTAAFLLPIFQKIVDGENNGTNQKALIIAPTRELALQILDETKKLGKHIKVKADCFYGGTNYVKQEKSLKTGLSIYIGTPGRLMDFNKSGKLPFNQFSTVVIDEADRLFDMGFYPDIQKILKGCGDPLKRQTMLFSATLGTRVRQLAWEFMNSPREVQIYNGSIAVEEIEQSLYHVSTSEKFSLLLGILKQEDATSVIIFTNTKNQASILSQKLHYNGYNSLFLSGDLPQNKRLEAIKKFKEGKLQVLIATDVAARGIHIDDLPLVINYDIPEDYEVYVHRIGRTARAGKKGKAITLACEKFVYHLEAIEKFIGKKIPVVWFDDSMLLEDLSKDQKIFVKEKISNKKFEQVRGSNKNKSYSKSNYQKSNYNKSEFKQDKKLKKPSSSATSEERLAYYKAKYGESFCANVETQKKSQPNTAAKKEGFLKKLFSKIFK